MSRRRFFGSMPALLLPSIDARAQAAEPDRPIVIATSTPGGGFALYGETLARVLNGRERRPWCARGRQAARPKTWTCCAAATSMPR